MLRRLLLAVLWVLNDIYTAASQYCRTVRRGFSELPCYPRPSSDTCLLLLYQNVVGLDGRGNAERETRGR